MSLKDDIDILKWISIVEEEINIKSDRALVITIASILDTQLEKILKEFMIHDKKVDDKIFNNNSPLSNFSSKVSMCYYLGLISEYEYKTLETIRKIRNILAHEIEIKKMNDSQSIVDLCNMLTIPEKICIPDKLMFSENEDMKKNDEKPLTSIDIQSKLIKVFKNLTIFLEYRIIETYNVKRTEYKNISLLQLLEDSKERILNQNQQIYNYSIKLKESTLLVIEKYTIIGDKEEEIKKLKDEIAIIDERIKAYDSGNFFYGTTLDKYGSPQLFMKILDEIILELKNKDSWLILYNY